VTIDFSSVAVKVVSELRRKGLHVNVADQDLTDITAAATKKYTEILTTGSDAQWDEYTGALEDSIGGILIKDLGLPTDVVMDAIERAVEGPPGLNSGGALQLIQRQDDIV
jgi:hypothetical protein